MAITLRSAWSWSAFSVNEEKHELIRDHILSGIGLRIQNIDSKIAEHVISSLLDEGIPVLCIHDSFIVEREHKDRLKEEMANAFQREELVSIPSIRDV